MAFSFLLIAASCSTPSTNTPTVAVDDSKLVESTRGAASEDDMNLLFARKWLGENAFLDLKIDNTFEGSLNGQNELFGNWSISEDQTTLALTSDKSVEGKGKGFNLKYTIIKVTADAMTVQDQDGNEVTFASN